MRSQGLVTLLTSVTFILSSHTVVLTTSQFTVQPVSVVQAQGLNAVFECRYPGAQSRNWGFNGEFPADDNYPSDVTVTPPSGDTPATLTIPATAEYNNTVVQCEAVVRDGRVFIPKLSVNATLQVQGPLAAVTDLTVNNVSGNCEQLNVTWDAPFSLNITNADSEPDIQYCVDVYNVTYEGEENLLQSECSITTTQYIYMAHPVGTYSFSVTPRSNIDGSLNGTISTGQFSYEPQPIPIEKVNFTTNTKLSPLRVTFPKSLIHECRVPDSYSVQIQYIDREGFDLCICSTDQTTEVCGNTQMIVLDLNCSSCNIERHRRCNLILLAESNTQAVMTTMDISTHDVYKVTNLTMEENEVSITVDYLQQSTDMGFVAMVYSVNLSSNSPSDVHYQVVYKENTSSTVGNLADRVYKLAVFDLNDIVKPERKLIYPAVLPNTTLNNTQYGTTEPSAGGEVAVPNLGGEDMNATEVNGTICIRCSSGCVGIIHSQFGFDQSNITLIPRTVTDSGQNCTESTESMPQGMYFAAIFKLMSDKIIDKMPSYTTVIHIDLSTSTTASDTRTDAVTTDNSTVGVSTTKGIAAAAAAAAATTVVFIAFLVVIAFVWRRKRREKRTLVMNTSLLENDYGPPLSLNLSQPHDQSMEPAPKDPVYDVAKKDFANSTPTQNNNKTETPVVYADLDVNLKANSTPPMQHPVVYALLNGSSLAPRSIENNTLCILPSLSPPLTAESVLAEIYPVAKRWEALGEALGIKEHHLDSFSTEGHEQVCLHEMILYYFNFGPHSWEDIVKALWEIGETEAADKIIRSGKCTVELPVTSPTETPPSLPPRNDTAKAASHQTEAGDGWQDNSAQESDTLNTKEHQVTQDSADDQGELDEYNSGVHFPPSTVLGNKSEDGPTGRKNNSLASTLNTINKMPYFPTICKSAVHDPIPDKEESTVPYCTTMIHSLGVFEKLDVPRNHKVRALGYLNSGQSALLKNLYQQRMAAADEVHENNVSHVVPQNDDTAIENNGYTVKQSVGDSSSIPLLKRAPQRPACPVVDLSWTRVFPCELGWRGSALAVLILLAVLITCYSLITACLVRWNPRKQWNSTTSVFDTQEKPTKFQVRVQSTNHRLMLPPTLGLCILLLIFRLLLQSGDVEANPGPTLGTILTLDDLSPVYDKLIKAAVKWFNLGLKLEVSPDTLINIRDEYRDKNHICLREMLIDRLNTATLTYSEICQSLRAPTVGRNDVAEAIEEACTADDDTSPGPSKKKLSTMTPGPTSHPATCSTDDVGFAVHVGCFTGFEMPNLPRSGSDMSLDSGAPLDILKKSDTGEENELRRSAEAAAEIYKAFFKGYAQQRVILAPTVLQGAHSGRTHSVYKKLKIKVEEEFHSFEINRRHYFNNVVKTILKLPPHISTSVREGCVEICFEVIGLLADEAFHLTIDQKQEMLANNITLLEYDGQVPYCCCELLGDKSSRDTIKKLYDDVCQTDYQNNELNGETVTSTPNTNDIQSTRVRDFPFHPTTWAYFRGVHFKGVQLLEHGCIFQPENLSCILFYPKTWAYLRGIRFEGVQLLEHGCIFQPENGDICHLEVVSCPGELELDRQVQRLHFEYLITSDDECLLSQWLHKTVRWLTSNTFSRCPLIQWMVTRLLYFDQLWLSVWNAAGDL